MREHSQGTIYLRYLWILVVMALIVTALSACQTTLAPQTPTSPESTVTRSVERYDWNRQGEQRNLVIDGQTYPVEIIDDLIIYEGDMILGNLAELESGTLSTQSITQDTVCNPFCNDARWPNATVPFEIDASVTSAMLTRINSAMAAWTADTGFIFRPKTASDNDYVVFRRKDSSCSSELGRRGGKQFINLDATQCSSGAIIHEIGHTVGLHHEQNRCDRDSFVTINFENIEVGYKYQFDKKCGLLYTDRGNYDFDSIMHYDRFAFSKNGLSTIDCINQSCPTTMGDRIGGLSQGDVAAIRSFYGLPAPSFSLFTSDLESLPGTSVASSITIQRIGGFSGAVQLAVDSAPTGVTISFGSNPVSATNASFTVNLGPNLPFGNHTIRIRGTSGTLVRFVNLQLQVKPFLVNLSEPSVILATGASSSLSDRTESVTVTIARAANFTSPVTLQFSGLPSGAGVGASLSPTTITTNSSTLSVTAGRFTPSGDFTATVTASAGSTVDDATLGIEVLNLDPIEPVQP
jgi:Astacin (Peptidase family M12A)